MTPVIPCSISNISPIPVTAFAIKNNCLTRYSTTRKSTKHTISSQRFFLPLPSIRFFSHNLRGCALHHKSGLHILSATGIDVAVEESDSPTADEGSAGTSDVPSDVETSETNSTKSDPSPTPAQSRRSRTARKSEMPPVKNEELIPDGLVHVSRLSDNFVKDVGSFVSVGQEVKVRLVEANTETGRISLTMREKDDISKLQQQDTPTGSEKARPARRSTSKPNQRRDELKTTKFVKGQDLEGTVKNLTRSGAFISLPEGEEGFLPTSEEADDGFSNMMGSSSLQVGQEVSVRVLRITRGQVTLTMKKEEDAELDLQLAQGVVHTATNPFVLAFSKNKDIAAFLDERDKAEKKSNRSEKLETLKEIEGKANQTETGSSIPGVLDQPASKDEVIASVSPAVDETVEGDDIPLKKDEVADIVNNNEEPEIIVSSSSESLDAAFQTTEKESEENTKSLTPEGSLSTENQVIEEAPSSDLSGEIAEQVLSTDSAKDGEVIESQTNDTKAKDDVQIQTPGAEEKETGKTTETLAPEASASTEKQSIEEASSTELSGEIAEQVSSSDGPKDEVVESQTDNAIAKDEEQILTPTTESETSLAPPLEEEVGGPTPDKNGSITSSGVQPDVSSPQETKATISPALVKQLREETGAGMMDCKKALAESGADIVKAQEFLRKKGLASADKKASRATAEGRIGSYIHDSRIGVLVEVNCETDFVSRGDIFKALVDDLAMQVAACPQVKYLVTEDVPEEFVNKEKEIEMQKEDLLSKPEQIRSKIVEGRIRKRLEELALLEQPYIKNDKMVVKDWVKQTIATIGENIKVKRFVRYNLGEGLEKKSQDFAAEVAAQTAAKPVAEDQPAPAETKETVDKLPAEYLRKKGLSTADKKSSRLAAEGRIGSYIHDSRIGVLIEVNCETDFVGRSEKFKELVDDLAMQVVACPQVQFVSIDDISESIISKEKELEMQREDLLSKPENIRERIVEGRVSKRLGELALLEQPFIKDDSLLVKDLVKQTVAAIGENIKVRRFVRFTLGETNEDTKTETEA
ncbi:Elongation factor Ts, mitochondrial [Melia azedarach]|uniref:Elongation factor Ts, mitochondrial n=1 Tax=Melia azedarach TaxID=155640 RepID=A0ACC1XBB7_MELAZ|nr:Elongation factor Ts, mitochondrial [Melia azedarach]